MTAKKAKYYTEVAKGVYEQRHFETSIDQVIDDTTGESLDSKLKRVDQAVDNVASSTANEFSNRFKDVKLNRGVEVQRAGASNAKLVFDETDDRWKMDKGDGKLEEVVGKSEVAQVTELLSQKVTHLSLEEFGHLVVNGDWSNAIDAAITQLGKGLLLLGNRTYSYTRPMKLKNGVNVKGNGTSSILKPINCNAIEFDKATQYYGTISNLQLDGTNASDKIGVYAPFIRRATFDDVWVHHFSKGFSFSDGVDATAYMGYITLKNPRIDNNSICGIDFGSYNNEELHTSFNAPFNNLTSQTVIIGSGWINYNGVGIYLPFGQNITIDGVDISANTICGVFFGENTTKTTLKNAWHEFGSLDDIIIHKKANVNVDDTRTFSHGFGDSGVRRSDKARNNLLSSKKVLAEGNGYTSPRNAVVNGNFETWDIDQPSYWHCVGKGTNYNLTQIKETNLVNAPVILNVDMLNGGGRLLNKFWVSENDVGETITLSFDYKCLGDKSLLTSDYMFVYRIVKVASNSSGSDAGTMKPLTKWADYTDSWERVSHSVKIEEFGLYGVEISFNSFNAGQTTMDFQFKEFVVNKGFFSQKWVPSLLESHSGNIKESYYVDEYFGTMPDTNSPFTLETTYNGDEIISSSVIISGKVITTKPTITLNLTRFTVTPNDAIGADYLIKVKYKPTLDSHGCVQVSPSYAKVPYLLQ